MRSHPYSTSIGIVVIGLASVAGVGCIDSRGFPPDQADAGASDAAAGRGGQAGSTSSRGGAAGTKGTGGAAGSGGTVGSGGAKGGSTSVVDAAADISTSDRRDGASDTAAKDAPAPETRAAPDSSLAVDARVLCGPVCLIYCAYGNVLDANGCPTCACNPGPTVCPAIKCKACTYGYVPDANGCATCTCAPDPGLPCSQLSDATQCGSSTTCRWLEPGCASSGGTPALAAAGCYEQAAVGCTTSSECSGNRTCIQRAIDPCAGMVCQACGSTVGICL